MTAIHDSRMDTLQDRVNNNFKSHAINDEQILKCETVRLIAQQYANRLINLCPESRELHLALTKLEECVMWATAAIMRNE